MSDGSLNELRREKIKQTHPYADLELADQKLRPGLTTILKSYYRDPLASTPLLTETQFGIYLDSCERPVVSEIRVFHQCEPKPIQCGPIPNDRVSQLVVLNNTHLSKSVPADKRGVIILSLSDEMLCEVWPSRFFVLPDPLNLSKITYHCYGAFTLGQTIVYPK